MNINIFLPTRKHSESRIRNYNGCKTHRKYLRRTEHWYKKELSSCIILNLTHHDGAVLLCLQVTISLRLCSFFFNSDEKDICSSRYQKDVHF